MPIAYDLEDAADDTGRMDDISVSQRSRNAAVFCQTIKDADYNRYPQTLYHFAIWQYTNKGKILLSGGK